jgi:hypothetical protein
LPQKGESCSHRFRETNRAANMMDEPKARLAFSRSVLARYFTLQLAFNQIRVPRRQAGANVTEKVENCGNLLRSSVQPGRGNPVIVIKEKARNQARGFDIERSGGHMTRIRRVGNSVCEAFDIDA